MADSAALPHSPSPLARWGVVLLLLGWGWQVGAIWWQTWLPQVDLPDHMARHYLESLYLTGHDLPPGYAIHYGLVPNLGADLVVPVLMTFLPPMAACKAFLTLALLLYWVGPAVFLRQYAGAGPSTFFAALLLLPLACSSQFLWGFLNYYSGFGLAFLVLAHLGWMMDRKRPGALQLLLHTGLVSLLFLWHLAPWAIYGLVMGCRVLADAVGRLRREGHLGRQASRALLLVLPSLPSLILLACYAAQERPRGLPNWGGWGRKLSMPATLFHAYDTRADVVVVALWLAAILAAVGLPRLDRVRGKWIFLALAALAGMYLLIPFQVGGTSDADSRLLPALLVCALAPLATLPLRRPRLAAALLGACLMVRGGEVLTAWHRLDRGLDAEAAAFVHLAPGSRVVPALALRVRSKEEPGQHFAAWAVPLRGAVVTDLFHSADQHTLKIDNPCADRGVLRPVGDAWEVDELAVRAGADYVWVYNPLGKEVRLPPSFARVFEGGGVALWRVQ